MHLIKLLSSVLLVIGGLNWALYGILHMDLVQIVFGGYSMLADLVYVLVGLSAVHYIMQGKLFATE